MVDFVDFKITDNADWHFAGRLDEDGAAKNLTGATLEMDVRATAESAETLATLTAGNGGIVIGSPATAGEIEIIFDEGALDPGLYVLDLKCTIAGESEIMFRGSVRVQKGVTRA